MGHDTHTPDAGQRLELAPATGSGDMTDDPQYQAWAESMTPHCRCSNGRPCDGVLAGGLCDDIQDDPYDDDRVSLAYEEDDRDPHGLGGI